MVYEGLDGRHSSLYFGLPYSGILRSKAAWLASFFVPTGSFCNLSRFLWRGLYFGYGLLVSGQLEVGWTGKAFHRNHQMTLSSLMAQIS